MWGGVVSLLRCDMDQHRCLSVHMYMYVCVTESDEVGVTGNHPHFARLSNELDVVFQESFFTFLVLHEQNRTH